MIINLERIKTENKSKMVKKTKKFNYQKNLKKKWKQMKCIYFFFECWSNIFVILNFYFKNSRQKEPKSEYGAAERLLGLKQIDSRKLHGPGHIIRSKCNDRHTENKKENASWNHGHRRGENNQKKNG